MEKKLANIFGKSKLPVSFIFKMSVALALVLALWYLIMQVVRVYATSLLRNKRDSHTGDIELFCKNHQNKIGYQFPLKMLATLTDETVTKTKVSQKYLCNNYSSPVEQKAAFNFI